MSSISAISLYANPSTSARITGQTEVVREVLERLFDLVVGEHLHQRLLGGAADGGIGEGADSLVEVEVLDLAEIGLVGTSLLGPVLVDVGVRQDPEQPRAEVGALGERVEAAEPLEIRLLHQILGVGAVARHAHGGRVELRRVLHCLLCEHRLVCHDGRTLSDTRQQVVAERGSVLGVAVLLGGFGLERRDDVVDGRGETIHEVGELGAFGPIERSEDVLHGQRSATGDGRRGGAGPRR